MKKKKIPLSYHMLFPDEITESQMSEKKNPMVSPDDNSLEEDQVSATYVHAEYVTDDSPDIDSQDANLEENLDEANNEYPLPRLGVWGTKIAAKIARMPREVHLANFAHVLVIARIIFPASITAKVLTVILMIYLIIIAFFKE